MPLQLQVIWVDRDVDLGASLFHPLGICGPALLKYDYCYASLRFPFDFIFDGFAPMKKSSVTLH